MTSLDGSQYTLKELVAEMMDHDLNIARRDSLAKEHGFDMPEYNE